MNKLIDVLLIVGGYLLIALVVYIILYRKACKNYTTSSYTDLETYIEREEGFLSVVAILWPVFMVAGIVVVPINFIKSKIALWILNLRNAQPKSNQKGCLH